MINNRALELYKKYTNLNFNKKVKKNKGLLSSNKLVLSQDNKEKQPIEQAHKFFTMFSEARKKRNGQLTT
tara:strand:- start:1284 stop:1493 length:210 start_codon:yes stop_codon:yes gene_type:complete